jgi:hypothetical protein
MGITIFAALTCFGLWLLYTTRAVNRLALSSYRWAITEGKIVDRFDKSFRAASDSERFIEIAHVYEYVVDGRTFNSSTYCFGAWLDKTEAAYVIGTKVSVYYDPEHPEMAVLKRGLQLGAIFGVVPIGIAILFAIFKLLPP